MTYRMRWMEIYEFLGVASGIHRFGPGHRVDSTLFLSNCERRNSRGAHASPQRAPLFRLARPWGLSGQGRKASVKLAVSN
jgi:hypothetical protein